MKHAKMSQKIRYFAIYPCFVFVSLIIQGTTEPAYGQWQKLIIDPELTHTDKVCGLDIVGNGYVDIFAANYGADKVILYMNDNMTWIKYTIDDDLDGATGLDFAHFDDDYKLDVVAAGFNADVVAWYRNDGEDPITWIKDTVDNTLDSPNEVIAGDINGDGVPDIVASGRESGEIIWYENNLPGEWTRHLIAMGATGRGVINVADINDDDKPDVINPGQGKILLYRNNLPETDWTEIVIDGSLDGAYSVCTSDIDKDGDVDIAAVAEGADPGDIVLVWYENQGSGITWARHIICTDLVSASSIKDIDFDWNGKIDLVVNDRNADDVILFINRDGGKNWGKYVIDDNLGEANVVFVANIDFNDGMDIISSTVSDHAVVWYENTLGTAYAVSLETSPFSVQSEDDTLTVTAELINPMSHSAEVVAVIQGDQSAFLDTLQLFDDGLHSDNDFSDNIWGNTRLATGLPEDEYEVDLVTIDLLYKDTLGIPVPARFITLGPVEFEGYSIAQDPSCNHTSPIPGGCLNLKLTLTNKSSVATATNIEAELVSLDTLITFTRNGSDFRDIPAGDSSESNNNYLLSISDKWPGDTAIYFAVNITSHDIVCWRDTFSIKVIVNVESIQEPLVRLYPNPANDLLTVETKQHGHHSIKITSLNGQLLYTDRMEGPTHQIDLSTFQKGLYFITIRTRDYVRTEKIIKL